jgi:uncharacterized membrane protein YgaE (UPF0421/DUF939 family)
MTQVSKKKGKGPADRTRWDTGVLKKEMLKMANIDAAQEAELAKRLSEMSQKQQAEDAARVWQEIQLMLTLWAPYVIPILKQLHKKNVELDSMRELLEQSVLEKDSGVKRERLMQKMSEQRTKILEAISDVVDVKDLERQIRALVSSGQQIRLTTDSVLVVLARQEDE